MTAALAGLSEKDLRILAYYAGRGNRERYWNYLASLPGNDGYGLLALGVVRNDNMPGAVANLYAQEYAKTHNGRVLTEREWDAFGVDLIRQDLSFRHQRMNKYQRADLALNLPVIDVQTAHELSFDKIHVDRDAWTPRKVLQALRIDERGAEIKTAALWKSMLDNRFGGANRMARTLAEVVTLDSMPAREQRSYSVDMMSAYSAATIERPHTNPTLIGTRHDYYQRDRMGAWTHVQAAVTPRHPPLMTRVTHPDAHAWLEDTYRLRLERQRARDEIHPEDRSELLPSPHPVAVRKPRASTPVPGDDPLYAELRVKLPMQVSDDQVAVLACDVRRAGFRRPGCVQDAQLEDNQITISMPDRTLTLDMETRVPPREESMELAQQLDEEARQLAMQQAMERELVARQEVTMRHRGPVMRL
ncbi:hypothetical protein FHW69_003233 [Luteibacter sp. Sphag1AF]|uniref:hypothetical protein n=1 Tax=Luteibacter sp. Sphag1AF TaxID=2587031 RepID=UPI00160B043C|nr:hypothetical protein [Luteibacter sp. Sphag1AF]MBB3228591.1 hypothetical protein [Luteibacter sp. Sphag1AF]